MNVQWTPSRVGNPVLDVVFAWLDCSIWAEHDAGNHLIILGRVLELGASENPAPAPLLYFHGQYRTQLPPSAHN
ncbi:flavin reductase [Arthrobacter sp. NicSoilB8]|uniref:flavin reductase family protein n=1 Tax=Arthrobacter sp. NicSoilB8 TaxID=2830998 RepID=UPI001CC6E206|nr:flavin reductase [Arthrobacter sp. NicSoilB8]